MSNKVDSFGLVVDPIVFVERQLYREKAKLTFFRAVYILLNILMSLLALSVAIVTPLVLSHIIFDDPFPIWFIFFSAIASAVIALIGSIVNFFVIKPRYENARRLKHLIQKEIILYATKSGDYEGKTSADLLIAKKTMEHMEFGNYAVEGDQDE